MSVEPTDKQEGDKPTREFKTLSVAFWLWFYITFLIGNNALGSFLAISELSKQGVEVQLQSFIHAFALAGAAVGMIGLMTTKEFRSKMRVTRKMRL